MINDETTTVLDERWYINKSDMIIKIHLISIQEQDKDEIDIRYCMTYNINDTIVDMYRIENPISKLPNEIDKFEYQNKELDKILVELSSIFKSEITFLVRLRNTKKG